MRIGSRAAATREPRQVRKEAAINAARRVPRIGLVRAGLFVGHANVSGRRRVHGKFHLAARQIGGARVMLTMAVGQSDDVDPADAIAEVLAQCRSTLGGQKPQAGILFSALDSFDPSLVAAVREAFPGVNVVGSTSAAEMSSAVGYREDSVTLALFASDTIDVTVGLAGAIADDPRAACETAVRQAMAGATRRPSVCIVMVEGSTYDPQFTSDLMKQVLPEGVLILGGTSGRNDLRAVRPTYQFCNDQVVADGIAILLLSGELAYSYAVGTGFRTIGPRGTVTAAQNASIEQIDGRPARDFLAGFLDVGGPSTYGNPLAVFEDGAPGWYLRAVTALDHATGALTLAGSVPPGVAVQLTTASTDDIVGASRAALTEALDSFPKGKTPEAAIVFSCAVRKFLLGSRTHQEADAVSALLPSLPFAGMYCLGELAPAGGRSGSQHLNETFVTLLLGT